MRKKYLLMFALLAMVLVSGGCGGSSSDDAGDGPTLALLGPLSEEYRQHLQESGIHLRQYDTDDFDDHPAFLITREAWSEIEASPALKEAIVRTYAEGKGRQGRLVLFRPDNEGIDRLSELQGHSFDVDLHHDDAVLFYGVGRQLDGEYMIYVEMDGSKLEVEYNVEEDTSEADDEVSGASEGAELEGVNSLEAIRQACQHLREWLAMEDDDHAVQFSGTAAGRGDATSRNLFELASKYQVKLSASLPDKNNVPKTFSINHYIVSVHNYTDENNATGGTDWYYVQQEDILNGGAGYTHHYQGWWYTSLVDGKEYWVGGADVIDNVMKSYRIGNQLNLNGVSDSGIVLSQPKPEAINNVTQHTVTQGFSFGLEVGGGYSQKEGGHGEGKLAFGYNCTDSKSFNTYDVTATQYTSGISPEWQYDFKMPERGSPWIRLRAGADLGHSTYVPWQMWAWGVPTKHRDKVKSFTVSFTPTVAGVYSRNSGSLSPRTVSRAQTFPLTVDLPQPPLLAVEKNSFVYDNQASGQHVRIASQGGWDAAVTNGDDWITITPSPGRLDIQVSENTSGKSREGGKIRVTRKGTAGTESGDWAEITVTQLP